MKNKMASLVILGTLAACGGGSSDNVTNAGVTGTGSTSGGTAGESASTNTMATTTPASTTIASPAPTTTSTSAAQPTTIPPATVKAAEFQPLVPKPGDTFSYSETATLANKSAYRFDNTTQRVTTVNADGSWVEDYLTSANVLIGAASYNSQGNRTSFRTDASSSQNCDDQGSKLSRFSPEEKLLAFPLAVGATFAGAWRTTCGTDTTVTNSQDEAMTAKVVGYETVTTAAGVFNALRIDEVTVVTNSTNGLLPGGGYRKTVSVWFDPLLGRKIKYNGTRTYAGTLTPAQAGALVETSNVELVSYVKN